MVCDFRQISRKVNFSDVLILILLEYGLRLNGFQSQAQSFLRLNPYSIGIWSATLFLPLH